MTTLAVAVAIFSVTLVLILLKDFDAATEAKVSELQNSSFERMAALENEARVFTKSLGFNIFIHHQDKDLAAFYSNDTSSHYLSTQDAKKLVDSDFAYLNHLLPFLRGRYALPEFGGEVIIAGIEGEVYIKRKFQAPLEVKIESGQVQLGYRVAQKLNKKVGDTIQIGEKTHEITHLRSQLGSKDDMMVFMNLKDAQTLLNQNGNISGILALSCNCAVGDISPIQKGLATMIPHAEVVEFAIRAKARQQARAAIKKAVDGEIRDIMATRDGLRAQLRSFSTLFAIVMVVSASSLLFFLYTHNVKERRHEIAILRTLGVRLSKIYSVFILKAFALSLLGAGLGYVVSMLAGLKLSTSIQPIWSSMFFGLLFSSAFAVSVIASMIPVVVAARREPSLVLNEED